MKWFSKFLQDRQRPPLRTPTDDHDVKGGSNLGSQRGEQQVAIDNAGIKKPSAVGPTSYSEAVKTIDEVRGSTARETGQVAETPNGS